MLGISYNAKLRDIARQINIKNIKKYMIYGRGIDSFLIPFCEISRFCQEGSTWKYDSMEKGLKRLYDISHEKGNRFYKLSDSKVKEDKDTSFIYFPVKDSNKPFLIIIAGGAFQKICNIAEGFPIAAIANEMGYPAIVLNYHVDCPGCIYKVLDDINLAINIIKEKKDEMGITNLNYMVAGFSAGGTICAEWGTDHLGYKKYNQDKPLGLILGYPFISFKSCEPSDLTNSMAELVTGKPHSESLNSELNVDENVTPDYPVTYIAYADDDEMVPPLNSKMLAKALKDNNLRYHLESHSKGGHGFGDGTDTEFKDWIKRAIEFINK